MEAGPSSVLFTRRIRVYVYIYICTYIVTCLMAYSRFGLVTGFIGLLKIVTTISYSAIANSCSPQFTIARTKTSKTAVSLSVAAW
jgi:hypothetical protein